MRVSIIMSNRNDTAMLAVTVRSCLEALKAVPGGGEVVIGENSEQEKYEMIAAGSFFAKRYFGNEVQLVRVKEPCLFRAREAAIRAARGQYILCLDSHMILGHNMVKDLVDFMNANKARKIGFAHAPINWLHQHHTKAKHDRDMSPGANELGPWHGIYPKASRMTWKGMPWICKKKTWYDINQYGALSEHGISWGGGDMHIGIKPWLLGYENWAVPTSPAYHIGPFPKHVRQLHPYRLYRDSGRFPAGFGFLLSCYVLGGHGMLERNGPTVQERFGVDVEKHKALAIRLGEKERAWLDARRLWTFETLIERQPWEHAD